MNRLGLTVKLALQLHIISPIGPADDGQPASRAEPDSGYLGIGKPTCRVTRDAHNSLVFDCQINFFV